MITSFIVVYLLNCQIQNDIPSNFNLAPVGDAFCSRQRAGQDAIRPVINGSMNLDGWANELDAHHLDCATSQFAAFRQAPLLAIVQSTNQWPMQGENGFLHHGLLASRGLWGESMHYLGDGHLGNCKDLDINSQTHGKLTSVVGMRYVKSISSSKGAGKSAIPSVSLPEPVMNDLVLTAVKNMPKNGGYAVTREAAQGLRKSIQLGNKVPLVFDPLKARPSYCSGATYQVFLKAMVQWAGKNAFEIHPTTAKLLLVAGQSDGDGVWGRWNANGPGTGRFFHETGLGVSFQDWHQAKAGDFMKIWWNDFVGKSEHGHLVVFLGLETSLNGNPGVRFWSSNQPQGYGEKLVELTKIKRVLFSRLTNPANIHRIATLPKRDQFLADMLLRNSNDAELLKMTGSDVKLEASAGGRH